MSTMGSSNDVPNVMETSTSPSASRASSEVSLSPSPSWIPSSQQVHRVLVLIVSFLMIMVSDGISQNYGVLMPTFIEQFNITASDAGWAAGIEQFFCYVTGALMLPVVEIIGWRLSSIFAIVLSVSGLLLTSIMSDFYVIYFSYGLLSGVGLGIFLMLSFIVSVNYWDDQLQMAFTVITLGFEVGLMAFGPIIQLLMDHLGWREALRVLAAITAVVGLCGLVVFKPLPKIAPESDPAIRCKKLQDAKENDPLLKNEDTPSTREKLKHRLKEIWQLYCRLDFLLFGIGFFGFTWSYDSPYIFLPLHAQSLGIDALKSTSILVFFGLSGIAMRLVLLVIPSTNFKVTVLLTGGFLFFAGFISTLISLFTNYDTLCVYAALLGSTLAYVFSTYMYIVAAVVGMKSKDEATTGTMAFCAFADLANAPSGGALMEATGDPNAPFLLTGAVGLFCSLVYFAVVFWRRDRVRKFHNEQTTKELLKTEKTMALHEMSITNHNHDNKNQVDKTP